MWNIRSFFRERDVMEVETPLLSRGSGLDPYIDVFETENFIDGPKDTPKTPLYLNTSPEFHMKRLLCQGYPDIFQISKAFRNGETGRRHQWEFSILEWYRLGWDGVQLREEVIDFVGEFGFRGEVKEWPWRNLFNEKLGIDPINVSLEELVSVCHSHHLSLLVFEGESESFQLESYLDYLLVSIIEPQLGWDGPEWVIDYPADQAALARTWKDDEGHLWAHRFELYIEGVEICNGYWELTDSKEQLRRFHQDQMKRKQLGKRILKQDDELIKAMEKGLPDCSGVALGVDRLVMLCLSKDKIKDVLCFHNGNC